MITRTENIARCHQELRSLVGEQEAMHLVEAALEAAEEAKEAGEGQA